MTHPWSYTALKAFETCPRQYHEVRVLKKYPFKKTEAVLFGERMHKAAESYVGNGKPLPAEFAFMQDLLDALASKPGAKAVEQQMAVTKDLEPCDWWDKKAWYRGAADLVIVNGANALVIDYKSGGDKYPDVDQLELMALLVFEHYPEVQTVNSALLFVMKNSWERKKVRREDAPILWDSYRERDNLRMAAHASGTFNPKRNGLCKRHCEVRDCEFNGG